MMFCQPLSIRTDIINTTIAITRRSNKTLFMFSYILTIISLPLQICITCLHFSQALRLYTERLQSLSTVNNLNKHQLNQQVYFRCQDCCFHKIFSRE